MICPGLHSQKLEPQSLVSRITQMPLGTWRWAMGLTLALCDSLSLLSPASGPLPPTQLTAHLLSPCLPPGTD